MLDIESPLHYKQWRVQAMGGGGGVMTHFVGEGWCFQGGSLPPAHFIYASDYKDIYT